VPWVEITVALISAASTIGAILLTNYFKVKKNHDKEKDIASRVRRDTVIYEILIDIRKKFNFGRVSISQFHNGTKYYTGESIQKASVSFETVAPGISTMSSSMQNVPLGTMTYSLSRLSKEGKFCVEDVDKCGDNHYANLMRAYDEKAHYAFKIEDPNGWVGVLVADFCTSQTDVKPLTDACCEWMSIQASRLSSILALSNKNYNI